MKIGVSPAILLVTAEVFKFSREVSRPIRPNSSLSLCLVLNLLPIHCQLLPIASYRLLICLCAEAKLTIPWYSGLLVQCYHFC